MVQYRQPFVRALGLGIGTLWLPELDEPAGLDDGADGDDGDDE